MTEKAAEYTQLKPEQTIIFIGMMGAGKTTIGKALARELGRDFIDLDHEIVRRCGVAIPTIFDIEGEEGFRKRETATLKEVAKQHNVVLATGGGAVLKAENQEVLQQSDHVVYLKANVDELFRRVARDPNRPLLQTDNPRERLRELLDARAAIYERLATVTIETGTGSIQSVLKQLKNYLR
ncbi:MAG: shikimate kinase [Pelistega sp.]|nr:shikimate kinase [Pelistega sp.]